VAAFLVKKNVITKNLFSFGGVSMSQKLSRLYFARIVIGLLVLFCMGVNAPGSLAAAPDNQGPSLRIGLMTKQFGVLAASNGVYQIMNMDSKKILGEYAAGVKSRIGLREGKFVINNTVVEGDRLLIAPKRSASMEREERLIEINNRRYRGVVEVFRTQGATGITAVNVLPVDDYIYGLMVRDLSPEWPEHALKAQTVAARTFALYSIGKHKNEGFDLCATSDCSVYEGQVAEDAKLLKAINDTRGIVLTYQGYLTAAMYHLSSGGYTENSETVLAKAYPYLRGVPDADQTSPYFQWQKKITPAELEVLLKNNGYNLGALSAIELSKKTPAPMNVPDRGISGRIRTITFIGKGGVVVLTGEKVQQLLSVPSSLFDIKIAVPASSIESNITDSYGDRDVKQIQINLPPSSSGGLLTDRDGIHRISGQKNETIFFEGFGWGHGLGLSQWGAKAMAEKAINPGSDYYVSILRYYYQGVKIDQWY
jgi:stage II sporulation protein D